MSAPMSSVLQPMEKISFRTVPDRPTRRSIWQITAGNAVSFGLTRLTEDLGRINAIDSFVGHGVTAFVGGSHASPVGHVLNSH